VQARRIKAREPHIAHKDDLEGVTWVAEPLGKSFAPGLVANVRHPIEGVGGGAGHHNFDGTLIIGVLMPLRPQRGNLSIELHADAAAHADDHGFAVHGREPFLEVTDDVAGDDLQPLFAPDERFELRPFRFELLFALDLLAFGDLFE
jgi:hypothetical protein